MNRHEEADCVIISYVASLIQQHYKHIHVVSDDTDVFALLVFFCWKWQTTAQIGMKKFDARVIEHQRHDAKLGPKSSQLLAAHAISGCDTVSFMFGKGKASAVSTMISHDTGLEQLGETDVSLDDIIRVGHRFVGMLYKAKGNTTSMNELRNSMFTSKRAKPKIKSLPPTDSALAEHIKRAHLQTMIWKSSDKMAPPDVNFRLWMGFC